MSDTLHPWHRWLDDEKTILFTEYPPNFTWEEYHHAGDAVWRMLSTVDHKVIHLSSYEHVTARLPPGALAQLRRIAMLIEHRNFEHFVVYGVHHRLIRTMGDLFYDVYGHIIITDTKEEALAAIAELRTQSESDIR